MNPLELLRSRVGVRLFVIAHVLECWPEGIKLHIDADQQHCATPSKVGFPADSHTEPWNREHSVPRYVVYFSGGHARVTCAT